MGRKLQVSKAQLKVPSRKKRRLDGDLVDRSELPATWKDHNRFFIPKSQRAVNP